jgi:hypothetical protein
METMIPRLDCEKCPAPIFPKVLLPVDPLRLKGLDPDGIDRLVPDFARKGTAVDGGPKWTWMDRCGIVWEIRFHPHTNHAFPSRPSGYGSTIRFGMKLVSGLGGIEEIQSIDQDLVKGFGLPPQPAPLNATQYVDRFGFIYFDIHGEVAGLYSDEGHIN